MSLVEQSFSFQCSVVCSICLSFISFCWPCSCLSYDWTIFVCPLVSSNSFYNGGTSKSLMAWFIKYDINIMGDFFFCIPAVFDIMHIYILKSIYHKKFRRSLYMHKETHNKLHCIVFCPLGKKLNPWCT